jgi:hypothetical protein
MKQFWDYMEVINEAKQVKVNPMGPLKELAKTDMVFIKKFVMNISNSLKKELTGVSDYKTLMEASRIGVNPKSKAYSDVRQWMRTFFEDHFGALKGGVYFPDGTKESANSFKDYAIGMNDGENPLENCLVLLNKLLEKGMSPEDISATIGF